MTEEKEYVVEQSSVGIFHHFLPPFIPCGIMFGLRLYIIDLTKYRTVESSLKMLTVLLSFEEQLKLVVFNLGFNYSSPHFLHNPNHEFPTRALLMKMLTLPEGFWV